MNKNGEEELLTIGEVAKRTSLSVQTVRFYEQKELIAPDYIDPKSGYRYYSVASMLTLRMIRELRKANFTVEEVRETILASTETHLLSLIEQKLAAIKDEMEQLKRAERFLFQKKEHLHRIIHPEPHIDEPPFRLIHFPGTWYVGHRKRDKLNMARNTVNFNLLNKTIEDLGFTSTGYMFTRFHSERPKCGDGEADMEYCIPVDYHIELEEWLHYLPAAIYVTGSVPSIEGSRHLVPKMYDWIREQGYIPFGPSREIYEMDLLHVRLSKRFAVISQIPIQIPSKNSKYT
ncbi:MAG: MerR family transcriptional regulator [Bacilli bacterium]